MLQVGDYDCNSDVMVEGNVFTYPYYLSDTDPVWAVKILQPMTPSQNYFEHQIKCSGEECTIGIGVVGSDYLLDNQPGWRSNGIGYHADDGQLFVEQGHGVEFGPTCTTGDRMGCGVVFDSKDSPDYVKVFFTKNGQQVGDFVRFKNLEGGLYPLIGMHSRGEQFNYLGCWNHLPKAGKFICTACI